MGFDSSSAFDANPIQIPDQPEKPLTPEQQRARQAARDAGWARAAGRSLAAGFSGELSQVGELGAAYYKGGAKALREKALYQEAVAEEYPVTNLVFGTGIPLIASLLSMGGAGAAIAGEKVVANQTRRALTRRLISTGAKEGGEEVFERALGAGVREGAEAATERLAGTLGREVVEEGIETGTRKIVGKGGKEVLGEVKKKVVPKVAEAVVPTPGRLKRAVSTAYKLTPTGLADTASDKSSEWLRRQALNRGRIGEFLAADLPRSQRSFLQNMADDILLRMPSRLASSAIIDVPLYSMSEAVREVALSGDPSWKSFGEHFSGAWAKNALTGLEITGYFGLAEVGLPLAYRGLRKAVDAAAEYAPMFGRQAKFNLWTAENAYEKTGIKPDVSKWMSMNKEMVVNAARYWPQQQLGISFEKYIRDMDAEDVEFFVRNNEAIIDAMSNFSDRDKQAFLFRLKNLDERQRVWMLERSDAIAEANMVHDGIMDAFAGAMDGEIQAWSPRAADELLSVARATTGSREELGKVATKLAESKTNEVAQLQTVLNMAYSRMIRDEDDILSSFGKPGGPPSSQLIVDTAHDLGNTLQSMVDVARSSTNKHAKSSTRRLGEVVADYKKKVESIVGKDQRRKDKSYSDLMGEVEELPASYRPGFPRPEAPIPSPSAAASMYAPPSVKGYQAPSYSDLMAQAPLPESGFKLGQSIPVGSYPGAKPSVQKTYQDMMASMSPEQKQSLLQRLDIATGSSGLASRVKEAAKKAGKQAASQGMGLEDFAKAQFQLMKNEAQKSRKRKQRMLAREASKKKSSQLKSVAENLEDEIDSASGLDAADLMDEAREKAGAFSPDAPPESVLKAISETPTSTTPSSDRFMESMRRNGDVVSSQPYIVTKSIESKVDGKTAIELARAMRDARSAIGEIVGEAKRRAFSQDEKYADRFKRAASVAGSMYHITRTILRDEKVWGEAASIRASIDNLYHEMMSETGSSGNFRKHFMQSSGKTAADDKVRASVSYDKVLKFAKSLVDTVPEKQAVDEGVAAASRRFEELTGQKLQVPKMASEVDSWHSMNRILNETVDVIERHMSDLVDPPGLEAARKSLNPDAYSFAARSQTDRFLKSLRDIASQSANATEEASRTMQNRQMINNVMEKTRNNLNSMATDVVTGTGVIGQELRGFNASRLVPSVGPTAKLAMALRAAGMVADQIKGRYQVASQLKAMVDADVARRLAEDKWSTRTQNWIGALRRAAVRNESAGYGAYSDAKSVISQIIKDIAYSLGIDESEVTQDQISQKVEELQRMDEEDKLFNLNQNSQDGATEAGDQVGEGQETKQAPSSNDEAVLKEMDAEDKMFLGQPEETPANEPEQKPQQQEDQDKKKEEHTLNIINKARDFVDNPDSVARSILEDSEYVASSIPGVIEQALPSSMRIFAEIASVAPSRRDIVLGQERLNSSQISRVNNILQITSDPSVLVDRVFDGSLTQDDVGVLDRVYPSVAMALRQQVNDAIRQCAAEGISVPFDVQCAADRFLGLPVSPATNVSVARGAQGVYSQGRQNGPGRPRQTMTPAMVANRSSGRVYGASNLGMANRLLTDKQKSESRNA